jgi:hypothetical protein
MCCLIGHSPDGADCANRQGCTECARCVQHSARPSTQCRCCDAGKSGSRDLARLASGWMPRFHRRASIAIRPNSRASASPRAPSAARPECGSRPSSTSRHSASGSRRLSDSRRDRRQGIAVFPCRQTGTSVATMRCLGLGREGSQKFHSEISGLR